MKVYRKEVEPKFDPIVIELESQDEVNLIYRILSENLERKK